MPWTATIKTVTRADRKLVAEILFTNGTEGRLERFHADDLNEERLAVLVGAFIERLEKRELCYQALQGIVGREITPIRPSEYAQIVEARKSAGGSDPR